MLATSYIITIYWHATQHDRKYFLDAVGDCLSASEYHHSRLQTDQCWVCWVSYTAGGNVID